MSYDFSMVKCFKLYGPKDRKGFTSKYKWFVDIEFTDGNVWKNWGAFATKKAAMEHCGAVSEKITISLPGA